MPRPQCCRRIGQAPHCALFKPAGVPKRGLEEIRLSLDELEALRLADLEGLYQEQAALSMGVSRQTFGRIVGSARRKTAQALILGRALRMEGGTVEVGGAARLACPDCRHTWAASGGGEIGESCPKCSNANVNGHHGAEPGGRPECPRGELSKKCPTVMKGNGK